MAKKLKGTKAHQRYYVEVGGEQVLVPGVTTVLNLHGGNKQVLVNWANKLGLEGVDATEYSNRAKKIGSCAHHLIECDMLGTESDVSLYAPYEVEIARNALESYRAWRESDDVTPVFTEKGFSHGRLFYGGTVDMYGEFGDKLVLIDFKTATDIYPEHRYQVAAYWEMLSHHGLIVDEAWILSFPKENGNTFKKVTVQAEEKDILFEGFLGLLSLYRTERKLKEFQKGGTSK
jgi:hypothetical protein